MRIWPFGKKNTELEKCLQAIRDQEKEVHKWIMVCRVVCKNYGGSTTALYYRAVAKRKAAESRLADLKSVRCLETT